MAHKGSLPAVVLWLFAAAACAATTTEDGIALFKAGKYRKAKVTFESVLHRKRNDPNALYYYALTQHRLRDTAGARKTYQYIVTYLPDTAAAVYARKALGLPAKPPSAIAKEEAAAANAAPAASSKPEQNTKNETAESKPTPAGPELPAGFPVAIIPGALNIKWDKPYEAGNVPAAVAETIKRSVGDQIKFQLNCAKGDEANTGAKIIKFYKTEFASKGWPSEPSSSDSSATDQKGTFVFKKRQSKAQLNVAPADGSVNVTISYMAISE